MGPYCGMTWAGHALDIDRYEGADLNKNSYEGGRKLESWSGDKSLDECFGRASMVKVLMWKNF